MKHGRQGWGSTHRAPGGRAVSALLACAGLCGLVVVDGTAGAATSVVVSTTKNPRFGTILVSGKTVYTLKASSAPCNALCLKIWPALVLPKGVTKAAAGSGVSAAKLGTVRRHGGVLQVTYSGKPLYWFVGDRGANQVHGEITDKWGTWSVVVTSKSGQTSSGSGSGSGSGGTTAGSGGVSF